MQRSGEAYESCLAKALESVDTLDMKHSHDLLPMRTRFELGRFDTVQYLNQIDARKKLKVSSIIMAVHKVKQCKVSK